jgi:hypothetical protein
MPVRHMLPIRVTRAVSCIALVLWAPHLHTCTQCSHSSSHIQIHTTPGTRMTWRTRAQLPSTSLTCTASRPRTLHFKWPPSTPSCGAEARLAARSRCCQAPSDQPAPLQPCKARLCNCVSLSTHRRYSHRASRGGMHCSSMVAHSVTSCMDAAQCAFLFAQVTRGPQHWHMLAPRVSTYGSILVNFIN